MTVNKRKFDYFQMEKIKEKNKPSVRSKTVGKPDTPKKENTKYKTELCKNWIEVGYCRYQNRCRFAHGHEEHIPTEKPKANKNCKTFHRTMQCSYGVRCIFNHESREMK